MQVDIGANGFPGCCRFSPDPPIPGKNGCQDEISWPDGLEIFRAQFLGEDGVKASDGLVTAWPGGWIASCGPGILRGEAIF
jgi:hypothetical protein